MLSHPISKRLNQINPIYLRAKTKLTPYFNNQNLKTDIVPFFFFLIMGSNLNLLNLNDQNRTYLRLQRQNFFFFGPRQKY